MKGWYQAQSIAILAVIGGCRRPELTVDDAIRGRENKIELAAFADREWAVVLNDGVEDAPISFYLGDHRIGLGAGDGEGRVGISTEIPENVNTFTVRTQIDGHKLERVGRIFDWRNDRTILAVDIDETVSNTSYSDLFLAESDRSSRLAGSREALVRLASNYNILYITARPRFLVAKTRRWLDGNGFPAGPLAYAPDVRACFRQGEFKRKALAALRKKWPNLLIGLGDKCADCRAYTANEMLAVIVDPHHRHHADHSIVFPDWTSVASFLETHRDVLTRPSVLARAIDNKGRLMERRELAARIDKGGAQWERRNESHVASDTASWNAALLVHAGH